MGAEFEQITHEAEEKMAAEKNNVEQDIKVGMMSVEDATNKALQRLSDTHRDAIKKIAPDQEALNKPENDPYIKRLAAAGETAKLEIQKNQERYKKIENFVSKKVDLDYTLAKNEPAISQARGKKDLPTIKALQLTINGLKQTRAEFDGMEAPGLETEKKATLDAADAQIKTMGQVQAEIVQTEVNKNNAAVDSVKLAFDNDSLPTNIDVTTFENHLNYLLQMENEIEGDLKAAVTAKVQEMMPYSAKIEQSLDKSDEYKAAKANKARAMDNYAAAEANYRVVTGNPNSTDQQKRDALSWRNGADQASKKAEDSFDLAKQQTLAKWNEAPKVKPYSDEALLASINETDKSVLRAFRERYDKEKTLKNWSDYQDYVANMAKSYGFSKPPRATMPYDNESFLASLDPGDRSYLSILRTEFENAKPEEKQAKWDAYQNSIAEMTKRTGIATPAKMPMPAEETAIA